MSAFSRGCFNLHCSTLNSSRAILFRSIPKTCHSSTPRSFTSTSTFALKFTPKTKPKPNPKPKAKPQPKPQAKVPVRIAAPVKALEVQPSIPKPAQAESQAKVPLKATAPTKALEVQWPILKPAAYQTYDEILAAKSRITPLYKAPSHTSFMFFSYSAGVFLTGFAALTYWNSYLNVPDGISPWVPYAFAVTCFFLTACGGYVFTAPSGLIRSITAVPTRLLSPRPPNATVPIHLRIELKKVLPVPFFPARVLTLPPASCTLMSHLYHPLSPAEERQVLEMIETKEREEAEYSRTHIIGRGMRKVSKSIFGFVRGFGRCWTREGFVMLKVEGEGSTSIRKLKIDEQAGWAAERGRSLERLVKVKVTA